MQPNQTKSRTTLAVSIDTQSSGTGSGLAALEETLRRHLATLLANGALFSEVLTTKSAEGEIVIFNMNSNVKTEAWSPEVVAAGSGATQRTTLSVSVDAQLDGPNPTLLVDILKRHLAKFLAGGILFAEVSSLPRLKMNAQGDFVIFNMNANVISQVWPPSAVASPGANQTQSGGYPEPPPFVADQEPPVGDDQEPLPIDD